MAGNNSNNKSKRGTAAMPKSKAGQIQSEGGKARANSDDMSKLGQQGAEARWGNR